MKPNPADGPISKIVGVKVQDGFKCTMPGCYGFVSAAKRSLSAHQESYHSDIRWKFRSRIAVQCQSLSAATNDRTYIEVITGEETAFEGWEQIQKAAEKLKLFEYEELFTMASSEREKGLVLSQTRWDELIVAVNISRLQKTAFYSELSQLEPFCLLKSLVKEYYQEIVPQITGLPILTRRYIMDPGSP